MSQVYTKAHGKALHQSESVRTSRMNHSHYNAAIFCLYCQHWCKWPRNRNRNKSFFGPMSVLSKNELQWTLIEIQVLFSNCGAPYHMDWIKAWNDNFTCDFRSMGQMIFGDGCGSQPAKYNDLLAPRLLAAGNWIVRHRSRWQLWLIAMGMWWCHAAQNACIKTILSSWNSFIQYM